MKKTKETNVPISEASDVPATETSKAGGVEAGLEHDAVTADHDGTAEAVADAAVEADLDPVAALTAEVAEWKDKFLRAKAEHQNASRRAAQQTQDSVRYANASLLKSLLDVADDLERSIAAASETASVDAVLEGVRLVQQKLDKVMTDAGAQRIDAAGQVFDPQQHEALMQQPSADHAAGTVVQQIQAGYTYHDRVLRPAKVIIAAAPAEDGSASEDSQG